ncbi:hypothetical protein [Roseateles sp. L2-2]|uniref:hypothetical protein n=1 Tax=Roseateles TaxID=93681 RepID=UPI003D37015F
MKPDESAAFIALAERDVELLLKGEESFVFDRMLAKNSQDWARMKSSESGPFPYVNQFIFITGTVTDARIDVNGAVTVILQAQPSPGLLLTFATAKQAHDHAIPGTRLDAVCVGAREWALTKCIPAEEFKARKLAELRRQGEQFLRGQAPDSVQAAQLAFLSIVMTRMYVDDATCSGNWSVCYDRLLKDLPTPKGREKVEQVTAELRGNGVVPPGS